MKVTQMPPVHVANLVANSGNTAYGIGVIVTLQYINLSGMCYIWDHKSVADSGGK